MRIVEDQDGAFPRLATAAARRAVAKCCEQPAGGRRRRRHDENRARDRRQQFKAAAFAFRRPERECARLVICFVGVVDVARFVGHNAQVFGNLAIERFAVREQRRRRQCDGRQQRGDARGRSDGARVGAQLGEKRIVLAEDA